MANDVKRTTYKVAGGYEISIAETGSGPAVSFVTSPCRKLRTSSPETRMIARSASIVGVESLMASS